MEIKGFLNSYLCRVDETELLASMESHRSEMAVTVQETDFDQLQKWSINEDGDFVHDSGKFFRICGAVAKNPRTGYENYQPIIDQPEQGILGIITRQKNDRIEILLQAKIEPGNLDHVQYSPTVQATRSNYTGAHKGRGVPYITDFMPESPTVVSRGFQSEHGYKFYGKANDNVHVCDDDATPIDNRFMWLTLNDIRFLLSREHCINMDTRSVLATIDFIGKPLSYEEIFATCDIDCDIERDLLFSSLSDRGSVNPTLSVIDWVETCKQNKSTEQSIVPLLTILQKDWELSDRKLLSTKNKHFELVGVEASIASREVSAWHQPIVKDNIPKIYAFLLKKINGIVHASVQMVEEDFSWSGPELGPTLHGIESHDDLLNQLSSFGLTSENSRVIYDKYQSEEGGRFLEQKNRYMLIMLDENTPLEAGVDHRWMTFYQLKKLTSQECSVNIEARTLLSIASYYTGGTSHDN